jgi:hypothetical protein
MHQRHIERNNEIVRRYVDEGATQDDLSKEFKLTRGRIQQVLKAYGVDRHDSATWRELRGKKRFLVLGVHVSTEVKEKIQQMADEKNTSVSALINDLLEKEVLLAS